MSTKVVRPQFELGDTKMKITEIGVLSDKDRAPDTNPGATIDISMTVGNDTLTMLDPALRTALYMKADKKNADPQQPGLTGVQQVGGVDITSDLQKLTPMGMRLGKFSWDLDLSGYTTVIDYGLGKEGGSNIELKDCQLSNFSVHPKEGGSCVIKYRIEAPDVSAEIHGKLAMLKTRETVIALTAPKVEDPKGSEPPKNPFLTDDERKLGEGGEGGAGGSAMTPEKALATSM